MPKLALGEADRGFSIKGKKTGRFCIGCQADELVSSSAASASHILPASAASAALSEGTAFLISIAKTSDLLLLDHEAFRGAGACVEEAVMQHIVFLRTQGR